MLKGARKKDIIKLQNTNIHIQQDAFQMRQDFYSITGFFAVLIVSDWFHKVP